MTAFALYYHQHRISAEYPTREQAAVHAFERGAVVQSEDGKRLADGFEIKEIRGG